MGLYDRDYTQADSKFRESGSRFSQQFSLPTLTRVVTWLLVINVTVFVVTVLLGPRVDFVLTWFSVYPATIGMSLQPWRLITYQFLHDTSGFGHILLNMVSLYFFGPMLEQLWGSRRFLVFYLVCGAAGGVVYPVLANIGWLGKDPLVGASGSILGILAAGAILFPRMRVYVWGTLPVRISVLAMIFAAISILTLLQPNQFRNAGGEAAHLGGMAAGALYVLSQSWRDRLKLKLRASQWEKRMTSQRDLQAEVDRILKKVHDSGLQSLTRKEKNTLKEATKTEQMRNRY